jgi:hypothetical protein
LPINWSGSVVPEGLEQLIRQYALGRIKFVVAAKLVVGENTVHHPDCVPIEIQVQNDGKPGTPIKGEF